ncbi:hypothetical protein IH980_01560 [Patescibacteria group bacterium]|nr:hypothetical protein [Patescibacteria group bacterium]
MELPFTPSFFKKLNIFEELNNYNKVDPRRGTWSKEKKVLGWASSKENTNRGRRLTKNIVKNILDEKGSRNHLIEEAQEVLNSLESRKFLSRFEYGESGLFNERAFLAGKILLDTKNLKRSGYYLFWTVL